MDNEFNEVPQDLSTKQLMVDQLAVTVLGAIAGLVAGKLVDRGYRAGIGYLRARRNTA